MPKKAPIVQFHFVVIWVLLRHCLLSMISAANLVEYFSCMLMGSEIDEVALPHSALAKCPFSPILATRCEARRCFITFLSFCLRISAGILIFNTWRPSNLLDLHILSLRFIFGTQDTFWKKKQHPKIYLCEHLPLPTSNQPPKRTRPSLLSAALTELAVIDSTRRDMANYRGKRSLRLGRDGSRWRANLKSQFGKRSQMKQ